MCAKAHYLLMKEVGLIKGKALKNAGFIFSLA